MRKSGVRFPEEWGYFAGRARLYSPKRVVIFPEDCGYIFGMKIVSQLVAFTSQLPVARPDIVESRKYDTVTQIAKLF